MRVKSAGRKEYEYVVVDNVVDDVVVDDVVDDMVVDDYSRAVFMRSLQHKLEVPEVFKLFKTAWRMSQERSYARSCQTTRMSMHRCEVSAIWRELSCIRRLWNRVE